jgi:hypothetical protein
VRIDKALGEDLLFRFTSVKLKWMRSFIAYTMMIILGCSTCQCSIVYSSAAMSIFYSDSARRSCGFLSSACGAVERETGTDRNEGLSLMFRFTEMSGQATPIKT